MCGDREGFLEEQAARVGAAHPDAVTVLHLEVEDGTGAKLVAVDVERGVVRAASPATSV
jgi:hypothetical protein